jgi:hypothetical protein
MINLEPEGAKGSTLDLEHVAVIGGGRWARVLTAVLCELVPSSVGISVHSVHNAASMSAWAAERGFGRRLQVSSAWPQLDSSKPGPVIVANAARDHEKAIEWALSAGAPVLAEKPIALTAAASQRLATLARSRNARLAAAHVFLFARYLDNFSKLVAEAGPLRSLRVRWVDPRSESRYGEQKHYDPGLPVFADCLPHILSMVGVLARGLPPSCERLEVLNGGSHLELGLMLGEIPCDVQLARNGDRRQRSIEAVAGETTLQMEFSTEPGTILAGRTTRSADPDWEVKSRPLAGMLTAFLRWAAGGEFDDRLDVEIGLRACRVIDQTSGLYRSAQLPWLIERLASRAPLDADLRYALGELLQSEGPYPETAMEQQMERVRQRFSSTADSRWLRELADAQDPSMILRGMAR